MVGGRIHDHYVANSNQVLLNRIQLTDQVFLDRVQIEP